MKIEKRKVSELVPNPQNVRRHNQNQIDELQKSIDKFDAIRPIVIDENNMVLAGHGLLEALKASGRDEADVLVKSGLSERDKKKLLLADNKIYSLGFDDYGVIEDILSELGAESDFDIPGYDSDTLEELYGIKSVEAEIEAGGNPVQKALDGLGDDVGGMDIPAPNPEPPKAVTEARAQAQERKYIICPNCGEKIEV